jgi:hypothetical protein
MKRRMFAMMDANIWGLLAVPVGVAICFGPALVAWVLLELNSSSETSQKPRRKPRPKKP